MKNLSFWTVLASLFCTLSVTDALHDAGRSLQLAAMGNPAGVERTLAQVAAGMGMVAPRPALVPAATKTLVVPTSLTPATDKVAAISDWILHATTGVDTATVAGDAARLLGLSDGSDVNGLTAEFKNKKTGLEIFFMVVPGRSERVLVRKDLPVNRTIYWVVRDGALSTTVQRQGTAIAVVSGDVYVKGANAILDFFYGKASGGAVAGGSQAKS